MTIVASCPSRPFVAHSDPAQPKDSLTPEEAAFHDALAKNRSVADLFGNQELPVIAVQIVRSTSKANWWRREDVRSRLPVAVRTIL